MSDLEPINREDAEIIFRHLAPNALWFRKKLNTRAVPITGPFDVETREGTMHCEDGWLALDSNGDPYPIASDVFDAIYEPVLP